MASMFIDIPGVGTVEAKNAATEATLLEIVKAINKTTAALKTAATAAAPAPTADPVDKVAGTAAVKLEKLGQQAAFAAGSFTVLSSAIIGAVKTFADVGDSITSSAGVFAGIPLFGPMFAAVAGAADKMTSAYQSAAASGATFSGSMTEFSHAATAAGMTMEKFGALISRNGEGMLGFASNTEDGAKRFSEVSKTLRTTNTELYALGYSTDDINQGLANYSKNLRLQGFAGKRSNDDMVKGASAYLKEMDLLAKITGESRADKEAERAVLLKDAQFQAATAGLSEDVKKSFLDTVQGLPGPLQTLAKDIIATGTTTTEATGQLSAFMPKSRDMLVAFKAKTDRDEAITEKERNALNNLMAKEGAAAIKQNKTAFAVSGAVLESTVLGTGAALQMQQDAISGATEKQAEAAAKTDQLNKAMEANKQVLSSLSNSFTEALTTSGMLPVLMSTFQALGEIVKTFILPVFSLLSSNATVFGFIIGTTVAAMGFLKAALVLSTLGVTSESIARAINAGNMAVFGIAATGATLSLSLLASPVVLLAAGILAVIAALSYLYATGWDLETVVMGLFDAFGRLSIGIQRFVNEIQMALPSWMGGKTKEENRIAAAKLDQESKELDDRAALRDEDRRKNRAERGIVEETEKNAKDLKTANAKAADAAEAKVNLDDPTALLKREMESSSGFVKMRDQVESARDAQLKTPAGSTSSEAKWAEPAKAKQTITPTAETAKQKLFTDEKEKNANISTGQVGQPTTADAALSNKVTAATNPVQDQTESLLTSLNSKLDQLISISQDIRDVNGDQLSAISSAGSDLYSSV